MYVYVLPDSGENSCVCVSRYTLAQLSPRLSSFRHNAARFQISSAVCKTKSILAFLAEVRSRTPTQTATAVEVRSTGFIA